MHSYNQFLVLLWTPFRFFCHIYFTLLVIIIWLHSYKLSNQLYTLSLFSFHLHQLWNVWYLGFIWEWWVPVSSVHQCHEDCSQGPWCLPLWECQRLHQLLFWLPPPGYRGPAVWHAAFAHQEVSILVALLQWRDLQPSHGKDPANRLSYVMP